MEVNKEVTDVSNERIPTYELSDLMHTSIFAVAWDRFSANCKWIALYFHFRLMPTGNSKKLPELLYWTVGQQNMESDVAD